ncbi:MAG: serine/threonine protein kinase [Bacillota bacterium]
MKKPVLKTGMVAFGRYRILRFLGTGGLGRVYLAQNISTGARWAVKEIGFRPGSSVDLLAEPYILKRLDHPCIPRVVDVLRKGSVLYIIEDYFQGKNLRELIGRKGAYSRAEVVSWARQLAGVLVYLHNLRPAPVIYGDLKPRNIIIGDDRGLRLVDFGVAREYHGSGSGGMTGFSRGYAAPEQLQGRFDRRTDIYGFGATFYHVLTGRKYSPPEPGGICDGGMAAGELGRIISRCLQADPELRYQNAESLQRDLERLSDAGHF